MVEKSMYNIITHLLSFDLPFLLLGCVAVDSFKAL